MVVKKFVIGQEFPEWFENQCLLGRAKVNYDDDGEIVNVVVNSPVKRIIAYPGDSIMLLKSGLSVVPEEKAKKYGLQKEIDKKTI